MERVINRLGLRFVFLNKNMVNVKEEINMSFSDHDYVYNELNLDKEDQLMNADVETVSNEHVIRFF
jgi:uncharacterized protein YcgL (UPF0745 family)